ncbi:MAG TPA: tetratricopeptide repeat protein, partial [Gemmatimonadales bacterium]|nr:tetratricopeptide repeat protein [Gemmatimonadales bacterium]
QATRCAPTTDSLVAAGFRLLRADSLEAAVLSWRAVLAGCPSSVDARFGLGLAAMRRNDLPAADSILRAVRRDAPAYTDVGLALGLVQERAGRHDAARELARQLHRQAPADPEVTRFWRRLFPDDDRPAPTPRPRPDSLVLVSRTHGEFFQVRTNGAWSDIYLQGVNLGVALPGRYPSEFPLDSLRYAGWLDTLGLMGANTVRVYTILPPHFYRAFRAYNLAHPTAPIWLIHGVWTELPPGDDFDDPDWKAQFRDEMHRVVDLLHGQIVIPAKPGHASGTYDADVSRWVLAYIIGREWEPFAVKAFDAAGGGRPVSYRGRFLEMASGPRMDAWMAEQCDHLLGYEFDRYNALRPVAYTNWPTLDPLHHPTEANSDEEAVWRRRSGRPSRSNKLEYENDAIGLDAALVRATAANPAGWFASYHAYPYYPDFMDLDPGYSAARSSMGPSNYFGYLTELKRHHAGIPLLISEYGVPSSRGNAHRQPQGWDHGGHDEAAQAAIDARLTREIRESGAAGAIIFALLDEWFKKNWIVIDLEIPLERTRNWHNLMDAEQNYGIWAMVAGDSATRPQLGGAIGNWQALRESENGTAGRIRAGADASWLYVAVELPGMAGRPFPWDREGIQLAFDTYRRDLGQRSLPSGVRSEVGFEFLVDLVGPDSSRMRVTPDYTPYRALPSPADRGDDYAVFYHRPAASRPREDGAWAPMEVITNRARFGRDGTFYPAQGVDRGVLRYGTETASSLSDWWYDEATGTIELRIPWGLLNVTDPSTRTVLHDSLGVGDFGTTITDGIAVGVVRYARARRPQPIAATPTLRGRWAREQFHPFLSPTWEEPTWHSRLKPVYEAMREVWRER